MDSKRYLKLYIIGLLCLLLSNCKERGPEGEYLSSHEVSAIINDSSRVNEYVIVDLRERLDYVRGHLVSSLWMNMDSIKKHLEALKVEQRPIILYDWDDIVSFNVAVHLLKNDVTNFYIMKGGFNEWVKNGYPAAIQLVENTSDFVRFKHKELSASEAYRMISENDSAAVIDLRPGPAFKEIHIKNARSIPYIPINEFVVHIEEQNFPKDKPLIIYCDTKTVEIAEKATDVLLRNNYRNVYLLKDGLEGWYNLKYPVEML